MAKEWKMLALLGRFAVCLAPAFGAAQQFAELPLPPGARPLDDRQSVYSADLDGDGRQEIVVFYTKPAAHGHFSTPVFRVVERRGSKYAPVCTREFETRNGFDPLSRVRDVVGSGTPQVIAFWNVGASCQGRLEIFTLRGGHCVNIASALAEGGMCQNHARFEDLDGDGSQEILFKPNRNALAWTIYSYDGRAYVRADEKYLSYNEEAIVQAKRAALEGSGIPATARANPGGEAVRLLVERRRYDEAAALCRALLQVIEDPKRTSWTLSGPGAAGDFVRDKIEAAARIYELLGSIHDAKGELDEARQWRQKARDRREQ